MIAAMQLDLFSPHRSVQIDPGPRHVPTDGLLGIDGLLYYDTLLDVEESGQVLAEIDAGEWSNELDRRVQHYGFKYDYRSRKILPSMRVGALPRCALLVAERLSKRGLIDRLPDQAIVNEYRPGQGISNHVDCVPCFGETVTTVSFGDAWEMEFKDPDTSDIRRITLAVGSALRLRGAARYHWQHGIKRRNSEGTRPRQRRVSLTFRNVIL